MKNLKVNSIAVLLFVISFSILTGCSETKEITEVTEKTMSTEKTEVTAASNSGSKMSLVSDASSMEWIGEKVTGKHNGTIDIKTGELTVDEGNLTGGNFEIDFKSIKVLDIEDEATNAKLTGHLLSDDFFSAEKFPTGKFVITSVAPLSDGSENNHLVSGILTIKGISNKISFPAKVNISNDGVIASADFNIDRTLWDIRYGSGKFFEGLGDKMIDDEFNIKFKIVSK